MHRRYEGAYEREAPPMRFPIVALCVGMATLFTVPTAAAGPRGVFLVRCEYSHSLMDDPILHPGDPGASHMHDFFGNETTRASSTLVEMRRASSTCHLRADTSGYWFPAGYKGSDRMRPTFSKTYYFGVPYSDVELIPLGLQLVAGNASATSAEDNPRASWSCGAKGRRRTPIVDHPYDCRRFAARWDFVDSVVGRVDFPSCWDGTALGPDAVTYAVGRDCPAGFPHRLPTIRMQVHFGILDPCPPSLRCTSGGTDENVTLALSSGPYYTFHADFWNVWHRRALARLTARCLDRHIRCGIVSDP
jgi:hypothetical protein